MTASTEKPEHVRIYEEIKARQAAYAAAHPGRYYLLNEYEMDDIDSYHQIETLSRLADDYQTRLRRGEVEPDHRTWQERLTASLRPPADRS